MQLLPDNIFKLQHAPEGGEVGLVAEKSEAVAERERDLDRSNLYSRGQKLMYTLSGRSWIEA